MLYLIIQSRVAFATLHSCPAMQSAAPAFLLTKNAARACFRPSICLVLSATSLKKNIFGDSRYWLGHAAEVSTRRILAVLMPTATTPFWKKWFCSAFQTALLKRPWLATQPVPSLRFEKSSRTELKKEKSTRKRRSSPGSPKRPTAQIGISVSTNYDSSFCRFQFQFSFLFFVFRGENWFCARWREYCQKK